jgi:hypothetical protein
MNIQQCNDVSFHFLGGDEEDSYLFGKVIIRSGEMVLDIPGGYGPYTIVGKACNHWFDGTNTDRRPPNIGGSRARVEAKWASVGRTYVGVWVEDDEEFLFSFNLGSTAI